MVAIIAAYHKKNGETSFLLNSFLKDLKIPYKIFYTSGKMTSKQYDEIVNSDQIIIFTPTYWFGVPASLQKLIEDFTKYEEVKFDFLRGKRFACVAYSPHGGDTEVITRLGLIFNGWGCRIESCGLMYYRSIKKFDLDHWNLIDLKNLAKSFSSINIYNI